MGKKNQLHLEDVILKYVSFTMATRPEGNPE